MNAGRMNGAYVAPPRVRLSDLLPAKRAKKGPPPAPAFAPTDEQRRLVEEVRAHNLTLAEIAVLIVDPATGKPISVAQLEDVFAREIEVGLVKAKARVGASLLDLAVGRPSIVEETIVKGKKKTHIIRKGCAPDVGAIKWWEQSRAGYREKGNESGGSGGTDGPQVIIMLPSNGRDREAPLMIEGHAVSPEAEVEIKMPSNGRER